MTVPLASTAAVSPVEVLMLAQGGVALGDSADASRCYPDLWRSPAAARQAFHRARRVTNPIRDFLNGECHAPLRRATYQRAGAGKRPASLAFDPVAVPLDELRGWLEERVGPLARFAVEPDGPPPSPPASPAPPGRPQEPVEVAEGPPARPHQRQTALRAFRRPVEAPRRLPPPSAAAEAAPAPSTAPREALAGQPPSPADPLRLAALAERLWAARPKREHGVRQLDWQAWEAAAREAAGLPSAEWLAWRATVGTELEHR